MGRVSKKEQSDAGGDRNLTLFDLPAADSSVVSFHTELRSINSPLWTENKARLIQSYVRFFLFITKHGAYIDAFAGPQTERFNDDSWSAKLVLEIEPDWLNRFILCEEQPSQLVHLNQLIARRREGGDKRSIALCPGDCNVELPKALRQNPIKLRQATFCLLDQRTFECSWETVRFLASHKTEGNKIELFYFLPVGWLFRSLSAIKKDGEVRRWWGKDDVAPLFAARTTYDMSRLFVERFSQELRYRSVLPWPIFEHGGGGRIMYFMIHAADHEEAPKLMSRAYRQATGAVGPMAHAQMEFDVAGFDRAAMDA